MKVPLLDLQAQLQSIEQRVKREIDEVIASCQFINGPKVLQLESQVAEYVGADHAIGVSSGTDALLVALMALDVGVGDLVVTTPYSFFATAGAISRLGATPVFVDIRADDYNLDVRALADWFKSNRSEAKRVKAIIPVHLYGQCADMDAIGALADQHGIPIVEDAAQSIGSKWRSGSGIRSAGAMGAIGCYSFFPSKNLGAMGDGGMVVTSDELLAERIRKLRSHGAHPKYYHELIGGNFRLDAIQAAVLLAKLPELEVWHSARRANAERYDEAFAAIDGVTVPAIVQDRGYHIYNQYVLRVDRRDELQQFLRDQGVGSEVYYPVPFHLQKCFSNLSYGPGDFPVAERAANETLAIPVYPELSREQQSYVIEQITAFVSS